MEIMIIINTSVVIGHVFFPIDSLENYFNSMGFVSLNGTEEQRGNSSCILQS